MDAGGSRNHNRFLVDDCVVEAKSRKLLSKGQFVPVIDLSLGGMQLLMFDKPKVGERYQLNLTAGKRYNFLMAQGDIRWWRQVPGEKAYRVGVRFQKVSDEDLDRLKKLIAEYVPRQAEILRSGLSGLKAPQSVVRKLADAIMNRRPPARRVPPNLTGSGDNGPWVDAPRVRPTVLRGDQADAEEEEEVVEDAPGEESDHVGVEVATEPEAAPEAAEEEEAEEGAKAESEAEAAQEEQTPADEETAVSRGGADLIPLFLLGSWHRVFVDEEGRPVSPPVGKIVLPQLGRNHFACRLTDAAMLSDDGVGFRIGDIVVFTMEREAQDGDFVFAATERKSYFRELIVMDDGIVLNPLSHMRHQRQFERKDLKALWPAVAVVRLL